MSRAKCSTCGGHGFDSVLVCLGCDAAERARLRAEVERREGELISITGDLHKVIDRLEADRDRLLALLEDILEQCHGEWCSGDEHFGPCRQIREAQKEKRRMSDAKGSAAYVAAIEQLKKLCGDDYKPRDVVIDEVAALQTDNERLRALVAGAERKGRSESSAKFDDEDFCPWCHYQFNRSGPEYKKKHGADCEAFFEDGGLR